VTSNMFWFLFAFCIPIQCDHIAFSDVPFTRSMERSAIVGVLCAERAISLLKDDSPSLDTLICKKYITSPNGSSIEDLERLLRDHGCEVLSRTNVSTPFLSTLQSPAILHVRSESSLPKAQHWLLFLGYERGQFQVADLPGEAFSVSAAELLSIWDGTILIVDSRRISPPQVFLDWAIFQALPMSAMVFASFAIALAISKRMNNNGLVFVLATASLITVGRHSLFEDGFFRDRVAVSHLKSVDHPMPVELSSDEKLQDLLFSTPKKKVVFVDARLLDSFKHSHFPNAINLPVVASEKERRARLRGAGEDPLLIVYCQTRYCKFSEVVASRLISDGAKSVYIYTPGWVELTKSVPVSEVRTR